MANTTTASLKLTVQATGDNSGTWGQITNTNLQILEQAIGGYDTVSAASGATLTFSNGVLSNGKNQVLKLTGTISGNVNVVIPDSIEKTYIVENATSGAHTVTFKTSSGTGITWGTADKGKKIFNEAQNFFIKKNYLLARENWLKILKIYPKNLSVLKNIALTYFYENKLEENEQILKKIIDKMLQSVVFSQALMEMKCRR